MSKTILVPIDGSTPAWDALDHAVATFEGDRIVVLHVVDPAEGVLARSEVGYYEAEVFERAIEHGEELCQQARKRLEESGQIGRISLETVVEQGRPAKTIVEYAEEHDVDHVVIGSHGRQGVSRILLGSVAERVTRRSPVPVTIVR